MAAQSNQVEGVFPPPLVGGNHSFGSVTEQVCKVVEAPVNLTWFISWLMAFSLLGVLGASIGYLFFGHRYLGSQQSHRLGLGHRQLRILGWYWPRRYTHQCDFVPVSTEVANGHQSLR